MNGAPRAYVLPGNHVSKLRDPVYIGCLAAMGPKTVIPQPQQRVRMNHVERTNIKLAVGGLRKMPELLKKTQNQLVVGRRGDKRQKGQRHKTG